MDELAQFTHDPLASALPRARSLGRLRILETGRWHAPLGGRPGARFIAVRGMRRIGKSTIAANLAIALSALRSKVVVIDLDLRRPTLHLLFGVSSPVRGLEALLADRIDTVEQALTPTAFRNLFLVSGEGVPAATWAANTERQHRLLEQIWELEADVVIADFGTAPGSELVDLFALGAIRLVVTGPDARSIRCGYNVLKGQVLREIEQVAAGTAEGASLVAALSEPPARPMKELLATLDGDPKLRAAIVGALAGFSARLVGNRVRDPPEADRMHAMSRLIAEYLGASVPVLGVLEASPQLETSHTSGRLLLSGPGIDRNVRSFHAMAEQLLMEPLDTDAPRCVAAPAPEPALAPASGPRPDQRLGVGPDPSLAVSLSLARLPPVAVIATRAEGDGDAGDGGGDADGPELPAPLAIYMRGHPRHPVDWHAQFRSNRGRETPVRVFEVSRTGASIETMPWLDVGDHGFLTFSQIAGQPRVAVTVTDGRRPLGRAGLRFDDAGEICEHLASLAAAVSSG